MKNFTVVSFLLASLSMSIVSASALVCTDLQTNLKKGNESKNVLALQNFLFEKEFLTAKPNGYFGVGTQKAVIAYQKSKEIPSSGAVFAMTRGAIKKDSCEETNDTSIAVKEETQITGTWASPITTPVSTSTLKPVSTATSTLKTTPIAIAHVKSVTTNALATSSTIVKTVGLEPVVTSIDKGIIFIHGQTDWQMVISGKNFSVTSNIIYLQDRKTLKRYLVGTLPSPDKTRITLPKSLGTRAMSCGATCVKVLEPGEYFVIVETKEGGESYTSPTGAYIVVRDLQSTSGSQTTYKAIPYAATSTKLGVCNFIAYTPTTVSSIGFNFIQTNSSSTNISNVTFKDEATGKALLNNGASQPMYEGQFLSLGIYANVYTQATTTTTKEASCTLLLNDINGKTTSITSPVFTVSFDPEPTYLSDARNRKGPPEIVSVEKATILTNGTTTWGLSLFGNGFSSTTNTVYLTSRTSSKKYLVGVLPSTDSRQTVTLPVSLGTRTMTCGTGCEEKIKPGDYDVTVVNEYGESNQKQVQVKSFTLSGTTGTLYKPFDKKVTGARLGTISVGVGAPLKVESIRTSIKLEKNTSAISGIYLKNETTGVKLVSEGKDTALYENDSKTFGIYGDINTTSSTSGDITVTFDVVDYIGGNHTLITSSPFTISLSELVTN